MKQHTHEHHAHTAEHFTTETAGLSEAVDSQVIDLADGDTVELRIAPVRKQIGDAKVRMLAYNGSIPGPTLRAREGSELVVDVVNEGDLEATVHWHGLRLDNRYDGTHETQAPITVGGRFTYRIEFPDPGVYWYHRTSARTTARRWACTGTSSSSRPTRSTGRRPIARCC